MLRHVVTVHNEDNILPIFCMMLPPKTPARSQAFFQALVPRSATCGTGSRFRVGHEQRLGDNYILLNKMLRKVCRVQHRRRKNPTLETSRYRLCQGEVSWRNIAPVPWIQAAICTASLSRYPMGPLKLLPQGII